MQGLTGRHCPVLCPHCSYGCGWTRDTEEAEAQAGPVAGATTAEHHAPTAHELFYIQEYCPGGTLQALIYKAMTREASRFFVPAARMLICWLAGKL